MSETSIESNLPLAHSLARKFAGRGIDYEELYSAACLGLVKAAKGFDESRGLMFSTYAVPVILGEIRQLFRDSGAVKVSRSLRDLSVKVVRLRDELAKSGKEPRISEIAKALGVSTEDAAEALSASRPVMSLTSLTDEENQLDIPTAAPQDKVAELLALRQSIAVLPLEERRLLALRYWNGQTQTEAGDKLGMTQVQMSRKEKKILEKLKNMLN
ncbi:MAG: sigma-70 family RNA polymerase sigma factor [Oscillospiraceae bacterium]|jgi:RNA polymerase sporulation-specific sigma factor|nr:sigma-70 family RNA polymerase sigma factor [Oscillospiraceae bacterium]